MNDIEKYTYCESHPSVGIVGTRHQRICDILHQIALEAIKPDWEDNTVNPRTGQGHSTHPARPAHGTAASPTPPGGPDWFLPDWIGIHYPVC